MKDKIIKILEKHAKENIDDCITDIFFDTIADEILTLQLQETGVSGSCSTCSSCKHWIDDYYITQGYSEDYKICNIAEEDKSEGMFDAIYSGEGMGGELVTHKNFGCVLHNYC